MFFLWQIFAMNIVFLIQNLSSRNQVGRQYFKITGPWNLLDIGIFEALLRNDDCTIMQLFRVSRIVPVMVQVSHIILQAHLDISQK